MLITGWLSSGISLTRQAVGAQQPIDRIGVLGGKELAARVGPAVFHGAGHVHRPRRDQRDQHVLIDRQVVLLAVVLVEVVAEPVRERLVDRGHGLAEDAAARGPRRRSRSCWR